MKDLHTGGKKWPCVGQAGSTRKARELEIQDQSYSSIHVEFVRGSKNITYPVRQKNITFSPDNGQHQADVKVNPWWHIPPFLVGSFVSPSIIAGTNCLVSLSNQVGKRFNFAMILSQEYSLHLWVVKRFTFCLGIVLALQKRAEVAKSIIVPKWGWGLGEEGLNQSWKYQNLKVPGH